MRLFLLIAATALLPFSPANAAQADPRIDKARIDHALREMVSSGRAAGTSALVWRDGKEVYFGTAGYADREARKPFRRDTLEIGRAHV